MKDVKNTLSLLKKGDNQTIQNIYNTYRTGFLLFAKRYEIDDDQILDVYQDAIIALYENAQKGYLDNLSSSLKTYIYSIGKYMIYDLLKKNNRKSELERVDNINLEWEDYSGIENNEEIELLKRAVNQLGNRCQKILKLFYYQEYSLDEITSIMNYDNKNVSKSQKSRCLKQLKEIITKIRNG